jgi:hypothetical protein
MQQLLGTENFYLHPSSNGGDERLCSTAPQMQNILEDDEDRATFWKAGISGSAFLKGGDIRDFWLHQCGLPIGLSGELAELAQTVNNMGKGKSRGNAFFGL